MRSKLRNWIVLSTLIFCWAVVASQVMAADIPGALANVELVSAERITDSEAMNIRGEKWSPNGFPGGQCTWYADGRWKEYYGFKLNFTKASDGWTWWTNVTNANQGNAKFTGNYSGEIILNKWTNNPYGHVAFVESSQADKNGGKQWYVSQANWSKSDPAVRTIEGYRITGKTFYRDTNSYSSVNVGGSSHYPLLGFLYRK